MRSRLLPFWAAVPLLLRAQEVEPSAAMRRAIDEFRVQTTTTGTNAGGVATTRTRPMKPAWHGRVFENLRNDFLDAIPHQIVQRGGEQRKLRRNQFGFNITGPVYLPKLYNGTGKTFLTFNFEGMRESIGQGQLMTIPTTRERTGEWSHVVDPAGNPLIIYDPAATAANPHYNPAVSVSQENLQYTRSPFPGNTIPLTRLDPAAQEALRYYPQPNANAGPFFRNNYFVVSPELNTANGFIATVDHTFLEKHRVTVRLNRSTGLNGQAPVFPTIGNSSNPLTDQFNRGMTVEHIFTASPTNINTVRFRAGEQRFANQPSRDASVPPFPRYDFAGYQSMGQFEPNSRTTENSFQLEETFATRWKTHRVSLAADLSHIQINTFRPALPAGRFDFTAGLTSLPGIINTGHGFASFLLGQAAFAQQSVVLSPSYFRWNKYRFMFNDQWQVSKSLTLTLSANLETYTPRIEKYDRQSHVALGEINPANGRPGALVAANRDGFGRAFQPVWTKVEPAANLAWSVLGDNNTVLRLGYQRRYNDHRFTFNQFATQAFNGTPNWNSANPQLAPAAILSQGLQLPSFPNLRRDAANGITADLFETSKRQPTNQNFNASLQRQLAAFLILTVEYRNQNGRNDFIGNWATNPNAIPLSGLSHRDKLNDLNFNNSLRPYPQYLGFELSGNYPGGRHRTNSMALRIEKRTSGGLALSASYEYTRRFDDYSSNVQDLNNSSGEWSLSAFNRPHELSLTYIYELPFGPGKQYLKGGIWKPFVGGWSISGVTTYNSGPPIRVEAQFNNTGGVIPVLRASAVPGAEPSVESRGPELWFNPAAFAQPADFTPGNVSRTHPTLRNPGFQNHDVTMTKRFALTASQSLEFVASGFNFTNTANWNWPDNRIGPRTAPNANAGRIVGSNGGRILQLSLRFNF